MVTALVLVFRLRAAEADQRVRTDLLAELLGPHPRRRPTAGRPGPRGARPAARACGCTPRTCWRCAGAPSPDGAAWRSPRATLGEGRALVGEHGDAVVVLRAGPRRVGRCDGPRPAGRRRSGPATGTVTVGAAGPVIAGPRARAGVRRGAAGRRTRWSRWAWPGHGGSARDLGFAGLVLGDGADVDGYLQPGARPAARLRRPPRHRPRRHPGGVLRRRARARAGPRPRCTCTSTRSASGWTGWPRCSATTGSPRSARWRSSWPCGCTACAPDPARRSRQIRVGPVGLQG